MRRTGGMFDPYGFVPGARERQLAVGTPTCQSLDQQIDMDGSRRSLIFGSRSGVPARDGLWYYLLSDDGFRPWTRTDNQASQNSSAAWLTATPSVLSSPPAAWQ